MSKKTFVLNKMGVRELMQSKEMQGILEEIGSNALNKLGPGHASKTHVGHTRANVNIYTDSIRAQRSNLKNNTLLKAIK